MTARICFSVQKHVCCFSDTLAAKIHFKNGTDILSPRKNNRSTVVKDHNHVPVHLEDFFDELVLACRKIHILSVKAFAFNHIWKTCKDNHNISALCFFNSGLDFSIVSKIPVCRESLCIINTAIFFKGNIKCVAYPAALDVA